MTTLVASVETDVIRLREEFVSMPGLRLSVVQVARLLGIERERAARLLEQLEAEGLLTRTINGSYRRSTPLTW
jgi:DNA-binding IclR family transcriptional regulator